MGEVTPARFRFLPILLIALIMSFAAKGLNLYQDIEDLLSAPAVAQDAEQNGENNTEKEDGSSDDAANNDNGTSARPSVPSARDLLSSQVLGIPGEEELKLISELKARREALDRREQAIALQEQVLAGAEVRLDERRQALELLEERIKSHLGVFDERQSAQLKSVVEVYQRMDPKDAAPRFEALEDKIQMDLAILMDNKKFAEIMAEMSPVKATNLTRLLATRADLPSVEELLEN